MPPPGAGHNVALQLLGREVARGGVAYCAAGAAGSRPGCKRKLEQWQEADLVEHCGSSYASFQPPPSLPSQR